MGRESSFDMDKGATELTQNESLIKATGASPAITPSPIAKFHDYLRQNEPVYARLMELREKGWKNPKGDEHFQQQRQRADTATGQAAAKFYRMMQEIGNEMQEATGALSQKSRTSEDFEILDLVFCDGQVLRTHKRPEYRERTEASRLTISQLILALQRIRPGGRLIMLLHKIEALDTVELLYRFSQFSDIQVFKPAKKHAIRSTFYLIAKNVEPNAEAARQAVEAWKEAWWNATFGGVEGVGASKIDIKDGYAQSVIDNFGDELARLARPVWRIQADALSKTAFVH